jgi:hypothetical protein
MGVASLSPSSKFTHIHTDPSKSLERERERERTRGIAFEREGV